MSGRGRLWLLVSLTAAFLGCDPIQTGLIQLRVVTRSDAGLLPVSGASCVREGGGDAALTDDEGRLQWAGASVGAHQILCHLSTDGRMLAGVTSVEVPREAGRPGLAVAELELSEVDAPGNAEAVAGPRSATVRWSPPKRTGGAPVLGYVVEALPEGPSLALEATVTEVVVTGLTDGASYAFGITAHTLHGLGPSARTGMVKLPHVPSSPLGVTASADAASVWVRWAPPEDDGGSPLLAFHVTALPGGERRTVGPRVTSLEFSGLEAGASHAFTVSAENAVGEGVASKPSETIVVPSSVDGSGR